MPYAVFACFGDVGGIAGHGAFFGARFIQGLANAVFTDFTGIAVCHGFVFIDTGFYGIF